MEPTPEIIRIVQRYLTFKKLNPGAIDGIAGKKTYAALDKLKDLPKSWEDERKLVGAIQLYAKEQGLDPGPIDGLWGQRTQSAYDQLKYILLYGETPQPWRAEDREPVNPNNWPVQSQSELEEFYGKAKPTGNKNLTTFPIPYPMLLAWDTSKRVTKITAHFKVKDSVLRVLNKVHDYYGLTEIKRLRLDYFGGCFNYRVIRGGTSLSTHSWV